MFNPNKALQTDRYPQPDESNAPIPRPVQWVRFQGDPNHDLAAIAQSQRALEEYGAVEPALREQDYPLRVLHAEYTGLPAQLNGLLDPTFPSLGVEMAIEAATAWMAQPIVSQALYGVDWKVAKSRLQQRRPEIVSVGRVDGERSNAHVFFQQMQGTLPVYSGQVVVHLTEGTRRVSATSSYFPLRADARLKSPENWVDARARALEAAQRKLEEYLPPTDRMHAQEQAKFDVAPYEGGPYFVMPFEGKYHVGMRVDYVSAHRRSGWRMFVETSGWKVLGEPQPLVLRAPGFFPRADNVPNSPAPADLLAARNKLNTFALYNHADGSPVQWTPSDENDRALVNVAVHATRLFEHFTTTLRISPADLQSYTYLEWQEPLDPFETGEFVTRTAAPGLQLQVGISDQILSMGFFADSSTNPKLITFQTNEQTEDDEGKTVRNPSLDPEVIYHEIAHGLMWMLNRHPFDQHSENVPFWRALVEGYATYYGRSFAERAESAAGVANQENLWAVWAYAQAVFGTENALSRHNTIDGQDRLALPNLYPDVSTSGSPMYRVSMIWARALWDVRRLLGADRADRLALNAFMHLPGWVAHYEQAAEALLDEITKELGASHPVITPIKQGLQNRGIYAEQGAQALSRMNVAGNDVIVVGGDAGVRTLDRQNHTWRNHALKNVVGLATDTTSNTVYAATETQVFKNTNPLVNAWQPVGIWVADRAPLRVLTHQGIVYVGTASGVYRADPNNPAWLEWNSVLAATFHDVAFDLTIGTMPGNNHSILFVASLGDTVQATALTESAGGGVVNRQQPGKWFGLGTVAAGARVTAVAFLNDTLYVGTLAHGIWRAPGVVYDPQQDSINKVGHPSVDWEQNMMPAIPAGQAILRLVADPANQRLIAATRAGLFVHHPQPDDGWTQLPNGPDGATVTDLLLDGAFPIIASYDQGATWRDQNGNWQSLLFN